MLTSKKKNCKLIAEESAHHQLLLILFCFLFFFLFFLLLCLKIGMGVYINDHILFIGEMILMQTLWIPIISI